MSRPDPQALPPAPQVNAQLRRVLDSAAFANAPILSRFLQFLVQHCLDGNRAALKEYTLGVEVFERGDDFDPRIDTIVRTHARRLRGKLDEYYRGPGSDDPILIEVPKGHYEPLVRLMPAPAPDAAPIVEGPSGDRRQPRQRRVQLPAPRTSLVGRATELDELLELLSRDEVRLLTVTGAGGSGKTRLALQSAWVASEACDGCVMFVSLAAATDAGAMTRAIATALDVSQGGGGSLEDAIAEHLRREVAQPLLLVLDNLEQIAFAAALIGKWLDACMFLKVLATSRVCLRIYGEHEYPLSPLQVPQIDPLPPLDVLAGNPAVSLFLMRAAATSRDSELTVDNARAIAELCCRLDGLPLAIELVSAQAANLTPAAMLARFSGHLDLPAHTARDIPERQRTLRRTIDWSHELLDQAERIVFRRLSVFVGGFDIEGAEAVGDTHGDLPGRIADAVAGLAAKNLIVPLRNEGDVRYTMLETIRDYGLERLAASSEEHPVRRAHAAYCLVLAEEGNAALSAPEREAWLSRCDLEHDNFLAAIAGLLQRNDPGWAMRMAAALFGYWERREHVVEADRQLCSILENCGPDVDPLLWVKLLNFAGAIAGIREQPLKSWRLLEHALEVSTAAGDTRSVAACLNSMGAHRQFAGDPMGARSWFEQTLDACRQIGDSKEIAGALSNLAKNDLLLGDHDSARARLQEALALFRDLGDPILIAWCLNHLADVAVESGDHAEADRLYRESGGMFQAVGDCWGMARCCTDLGHLAIAKGDLDEAGPRFIEALNLFFQLRHRRGVAILLEGCAQLVALQGRNEQALLIAGAARQLRETIAVPGRSAQQALLEQSLKSIWRDTDAADATAHWERGAAMPMAAAIGYALQAVQPSGARAHH